MYAEQGPYLGVADEADDCKDVEFVFFRYCAQRRGSRRVDGSNTWIPFLQLGSSMRLRTYTYTRMKRKMESMPEQKKEKEE